ncbi:MAG: competence/damage-inducible protein A, partial [Bacillati bacterium ANGP1]
MTRAEIISVGTEHLLGQIVDTNATFLCTVLAELGIAVYFRSTVGDNVRRVQDVFRHALARADLILATGGLGPTD